MKNCNKCGVSKPESDFRTSGTRYGTHRNTCRECEYEKTKLFFASEEGKQYRREWQSKNRKEKPELHMLRAARKRAKQKGLDFNLTVGDIVIPDICPVLGIKLEVNAQVSKDNSPTLDRIIPELGYVKGNIAVISKKANTIKNNGSLEEVKKVLEWMEKHV